MQAAAAAISTPHKQQSQHHALLSWVQYPCLLPVKQALAACLTIQPHQPYNEMVE